MVVQVPRLPSTLALLLLCGALQYVQWCMRCLDGQLHCLESKFPQDPLDQSVVCHIFRSCPYLASTSISPYILDIHSVYLSITFHQHLHSLHSFHVGHILFISVHFTSCLSLFILYTFYTSFHHILSISIQSIYSFFFYIDVLHLSNTPLFILYINSIQYICPPHSVIVYTFYMYIVNICPRHIFSFSVHSAH